MPQNLTIARRLTTEYKTNPLGLDVRTPRLSWQLCDPRRGLAQSAYQIQAANTQAALLADDLLWDSERRQQPIAPHSLRRFRRRPGDDRAAAHLVARALVGKFGG